MKKIRATLLIIVLAVVIGTLSYIGTQNIMNMVNKRPKVVITKKIVSKKLVTKRTINLVTNKTVANANTKLFYYLSDVNNHNSVNITAVKMHEGNPHNACVYFVSEALRRIGVNIFIGTCSTNALMSQLSKKGWAMHMDLSTLQPGDICFTTNEVGNITGGHPTHAFIFMSWADNTKTVMNICDNQAYDYGVVFHTRPIAKSVRNKISKEAAAFFYRSTK